MEFNHFDKRGNAHMVDVTEKEVTMREAIATGKIYVNEEVMRLLLAGDLKKGDVLGVARVAGIMGLKHTSDLIPLCHALMLTGSSIDFKIEEKELYIEAVCNVKTTDRTGVEMEALTGVTTALLTIYDMCKAVDKNMVLKDIYLVEKKGGKSGTFQSLHE